MCEGLFEAALESAEAAVEHMPGLSLAWIHYANVLGQLQQRDRARRALEQCRKINPAMTPKHFEGLMRRISANKQILRKKSRRVTRAYFGSVLIKRPAFPR